MTTGVEILILVLGIGFLVFELLTFDPDLEGRRTFEEETRMRFLESEQRNTARRVMRFSDWFVHPG